MPELLPTALIAVTIDANPDASNPDTITPPERPTPWAELIARSGAPQPGAIFLAASAGAGLPEHLPLYPLAPSPLAPLLAVELAACQLGSLHEPRVAFVLGELGEGDEATRVVIALQPLHTVAPETPQLATLRWHLTSVQSSELAVEALARSTQIQPTHTFTPAPLQRAHRIARSPLHALLHAIEAARSGAQAAVVATHPPTSTALLLSPPQPHLSAELGRIAHDALRQAFPELDPNNPASVANTLAHIAHHTQRAHEAFLRELHRAHNAFLDAAHGALRAATPQPAPHRAEVEAPSAAPSGWVPARLQRLDALAPRFALPHLAHNASLLLLDENTDLARALADTLRQRGLRVQRLPALPAEGPGEIDAIVQLHGLHAVATFEEALGIVNLTLSTSETLRSHPASQPRAFISIHDTHGDFALDEATPDERLPLAALPGIALAIAQHDPLTTARAIDLERGSRSPTALARLIAAELLEGGPEPLVGLRAHGARSTLYAEPLAATFADEEPASRCRLVLLDVDPAALRIFQSLIASDPADSALVVLASARPDQLLQQLRSTGRRVLFLLASPRDPDAIAEAIADAGRALGVPDALTVIFTSTPPQTALDALHACFEALRQAPLQRVQLAHPHAAPLPAPASTQHAALHTLDLRARIEQRRRNPAPSLSILHLADEGLEPEVAAAHLRAQRGETLFLPTPIHPQEARVVVKPLPSLYAVLLDYTPFQVRTLPLAIVLEWFVRLAQSLNPHLIFSAASNLRAHQPLLLADWPAHTPTLTLTATPVESGPRYADLNLQLLDEHLGLRYSARLHLTHPEDATPPPPTPPGVETFTATPLVPPSRLYSPAGLDLSPAFHTLDTIVGVYAQGACARLILDASPWPQPAWTDPQSFDALLQLGMWWMLERRQLQALPSFIGRITPGIRVRTPIHLVAQLQAHQPHLDLHLTTEAGTAVLQLLDVQLTPLEVRP